MPAKRKPPAKRAYSSSRRALQAAQTRDAVLAAATASFRDSGWGATTVAAIAEEAGVAVETVYKGFGAKKHLLRAAAEAAVAGDDEPIPVADRPEFRALAEGTLDERIARGISLVTTIHERSAGLLRAVVEAAQVDEEVDRWRRDWEDARRLDVERSVALILGHRGDDALVTLLWVLYSPEAYVKLTADAGFTREEYEAFLVDARTRAIGEPRRPRPRRGSRGHTVTSTAVSASQQ